MRKFSKSGPHIRARSEEERDLETGVTITRVDLEMEGTTKEDGSETDGHEERRGSGNREVLVLGDKMETRGSA